MRTKCMLLYSFHYNAYKFISSDTEEEDLEDHDSGHESAPDSDDDKSVKSETSKYSASSTSIMKDAGAADKRRKVPMSKINLSKEFNAAAADKDADDDDTEEDGEIEKMDEDKEIGDGDKPQKKLEMDTEGGENEKMDEDGEKGDGDKVQVKSKNKEEGKGETEEVAMETEEETGGGGDMAKVVGEEKDGVGQTADGKVSKGHYHKSIWLTKMYMWAKYEFEISLDNQLNY